MVCALIPCIIPKGEELTFWVPLFGSAFLVLFVIQFGPSPKTYSKKPLLLSKGEFPLGTTHGVLFYVKKLLGMVPGRPGRDPGPGGAVAPADF